MSLSPEQILSRLWDCDENFIDNNTLTVYIRRLRTKIEDNPAEPRNIVTVRRMGYRVEQYGLRCVMKIFVKPKNKTLFCSVLLAIAVFSPDFRRLRHGGVKKCGALCAAFLPAGMGLLVFRPCIYISGNKAKSWKAPFCRSGTIYRGDRDARIECDDEGELYRLFQEVNSLVSILNAHAENEGRLKSL